MERITVNGHSETSAEPDAAIVMLQINTDASDKNAAISESAKTVQAISDALERAFGQLPTIETYSYQVKAIPGLKDNKEYVASYHVTMAIMVTVADIKMAGQVVEIAAPLGARVHSVSYHVSDKSNVQTQQLQLAVLNTRSKAEAIAEGSGVKLGRVVSIIEQSTNEPHYDGRTAFASESHTRGVPPSDFNPQKIRIYADVVVGYAIDYSEE